MEYTSIPTVEIDKPELRSICGSLFGERFALDEAEALQIVDQLEYAELRGKKTHGFVRVPWLLDQNLVHSPEIEIVANNETPISYIDCSRSLGYVAANQVVTRLQESLDDQPMKLVIAQNIFPTNTLDYYLKNLTSGGETIGLIFGTTPKMVQLSTSGMKQLGTNPFAIGFSHKGKDVVADFTTAKGSFGELLAAKYWGDFRPKQYRTATGDTPRELTELFDGQAFTGSILQSTEDQSDHRLQALAVTLQFFMALVGGTRDLKGHLAFAAIRKDAFSGIGLSDDFESLMAEFADDSIPGTRSRSNYEAALQKPTILLPQKLWHEISEAAQLLL